MIGIAAVLLACDLCFFTLCCPAKQWNVAKQRRHDDFFKWPAGVQATWWMFFDLMFLFYVKDGLTVPRKTTTIDKKKHFHPYGYTGRVHCTLYVQCTQQKLEFSLSFSCLSFVFSSPFSLCLLCFSVGWSDQRRFRLNRREGKGHPSLLIRWHNFFNSLPN